MTGPASYFDPFSPYSNTQPATVDVEGPTRAAEPLESTSGSHAVPELKREPGDSPTQSHAVEHTAASILAKMAAEDGFDLHPENDGGATWWFVGENGGDVFVRLDAAEFEYLRRLLGGDE